MFKLESYITPVLLNYVGKYVKNFKPEQSQVSLWDGDATFQNLDLELNALNEQINFPFTFISGHIHELLIHVPWVKITSEPIVITINTIECILKMKNSSEANDGMMLQQKSNYDSLQEEAPSGYMKSIVTKVVNNIEINCNNLILKFVEEDIVLSVNIRFLSFQTVNNLWKPAFTDINITDMILRKLITMKDLTLCLDRMDASGKIEIYQDPVVYRCSMVIRWLLNYPKLENSTRQRESVSRFDVHFKKIEFSVTEQQIPMILRLVTLFMNSSQSKSNVSGGNASSSLEKIDSITRISDEILAGNSNSSKMVVSDHNNLNWSSWAWNTLTSFVPDFGSDWSAEKSLENVIKTIDFGIYIDDAILTFKITEINRETITHKNVKVKYRPFVTLQLSAVTGSVLMHGMNFTRIQIGLGYIGIYPRGDCTCGFKEAHSNDPNIFYLTAGEFRSNYYKGSLFDLEAIENRRLTKDYKEIIKNGVFSMSSIESFLERFPAFVLDFNHIVEIPEELIDDEFQPQSYENLEFSNFIENKLTRHFIGDLTIKITSGLLHRVSTIIPMIKNDFLAFFNDDSSESTPENLRAVTIEEFDALSNYIPVKNIDFTVKKLSIQFFLSDHLADSRKFFMDNSKNIKKSCDYPRLILEVEHIELIATMPIYPFRLVSCASQQTEIPREMLNNCYKKYNLTLSSIASRLHLTDNCHMLFVTPFDCQLSAVQLIYPQYWTKSGLIYDSYDFKIDNLTITTTKVKLLMINHIINSIFSTSSINTTLISTLFRDACNESNSVYLELIIDNISYSIFKYLKYVLAKGSIGSARIFALDNSNQSFIMSGPENLSNNDDDNRQLLNFVAQYPRYFDNETDNLIVILKFSATRIVLDPFLFNWLDYNYNCADINLNQTTLGNAQGLNSENLGIDETSSDNSTRKKFPSLHENVHSPSDGERKFQSFNWGTQNNKNQNTIKRTVSTEKSDASSSKITSWISNHYPKWRRLIFHAIIYDCIIYQPTLSMNSIGVDSIDEAKERALNSLDSLQIFVVETSKLNVKSASWDNQLFVLLTSIDLIKIDNLSIKNFPWTLDFDKFNCYTVINRKLNNLLNVNCFNATIDATLKPNILNNINDNNLNSSTLGFCIYIHTEPIKISIIQKQLELIDYLLMHNWLMFKLLRSKENSCQPSYLKPYNNDNLKFIPQLPLSPTQLFFVETQTTSTSASISRKEFEVEADNSSGITAWIQWTMTKIIIELSTENDCEDVNLNCDNGDTNDSQNNYKIVIELEDIITSLDWQLIYIKLKNKITAAKITHYEKLSSDNSNWKLGSFTGFIMSSKDEDLENKTEVDFLNLTVTKAKSNNVYNKWMRFNNNKFAKNYMFNENNGFMLSNYITEIVAEMQMIELILPIDLINQFCKFLKRIDKYSENSELQQISATKQLPLVYVDFKGLNLIIPIASMSNQRYDTLILQTKGIIMIPHAENPICRTILRTDIYELAAQSNILYTPGSILEDRQYQIKIHSINISSTNWRVYAVKSNKTKTQHLHTMNENPALEWNKLENDLNIDTALTSSFINKLNVCCIVAPPMIFKSNAIVCGTAIEITILTDIEMYLSLDQIKLLLAFNNRLQELIFNTPRDDIIEIKKPKIESIHEELPKDSGIDVDTFSFDGGIVLDSVTSGSTIAVMPYEYVINCEKITIFVYELRNEHDDKTLLNLNFKLPLFFVTINQPNGYISQNDVTSTVRINCFDVLIGVNKDDSALLDTPKLKNYSDILLETKNGDPDLNTGIPPSFFIIKSEKSPGNYRIFMEMGRPTKLNLSKSMFTRVDVIREKLIQISVCQDQKIEPDELSESTTFLQHILGQGNKIDTLIMNLKTKQIVLAYKFYKIGEIISSLSELSMNIVVKPRKIHGVADLVSFMITTNTNCHSRSLLNPFSCKFVYNMSWESWQNLNDSPLVQIQSYTDSVNFEFSPEQLKIIEEISVYIKKYLAYLNDEEVAEIDVHKLLSTEQHYQDDLKAGAFQFADGTNEQFPLAYQVLFSNYPRIMMAWKYPQPRVLTRLNLNDVLAEIVDTEEVDLDEIVCVIEYWSDSLMSYQRFIDFKMSKCDNFLLLPNKLPTRAVSCIWRAVLCHINGESNIFTARDLAECLRIDSYFNSSLIPSFEVTLNVSYIKISVLNYLYNDNYSSLPYPLDQYKLHNLIPPNQCFATIILSNNLSIYDKWDNGAAMTDFIGTFSIQILDYESITMQNLLEPFTFNFQMCQLNRIKVLLMTRELTFKFSAQIAHSLTLSLNSWYTALQGYESRTIFNGIIIANGTNVPIRFTQDKTTDDFILDSRECYFYSWYRKSNSKLRIALKINNNWLWSDLFNVYNSKNNCVQIKNLKTNVCVEKVFYKIKSITSTQKIIFFGGQLIIRNELNNNFEVKLIKYDAISHNRSIKFEETYFIAENSSLPSVIIHNTDNMTLKLKFLDSPNSVSWTGDVPLRSNPDCDQPWLVKLPTDKKNQFFSIWVRIITENSHNGFKTLVLLTPLYVVQSWLPSSLKINIETPSLNLSNTSVIKDRGKKHQIFCPGTIEHEHELNIELNDGTILDTCISMSYNCIDQRSYFKRSERENIDAIIDQLDNNKFGKNSNSVWSLENNECNYTFVESQTDICVKYHDGGLLSSTLLIELRPWCYIINSYGKPINVILSTTNSSYRVPSNGVISPPKIMDIFYIGTEIFGDNFVSSPLQFVYSEFKREFSMPQINGMIPLEGSINIPINCRTVTVILIINSRVIDDIRIIKISSSHIVSNLTDFQLKLAPICVNVSNSNNDLPLELEDFNLYVSPNENNSGISIDYWISLNSNKNNKNYSNLYLALSLNKFDGDIHSWSCPINVNQSFGRHCITIPDDHSTIPVVVTVQTDADISYIIINYDDHPQFKIKNFCPFSFIIGQPKLSLESIEPDSPPFSWVCEIRTGDLCDYTLKDIGCRMPDNLTNKEIVPRLMFCIPFQQYESESSVAEKWDSMFFQNDGSSIWKSVMEFPTGFPIKFDQFIHVDCYGDIKVMVESFGHTIHINLELKSEIEVSIRDVRNRLMNENTKLNDKTIHTETSKHLITVKSNRSSIENIPEINSPNVSVENDELITDKITNIVSKSTDSVIYTIYFRGINIIITKDDKEGSRNEVAALYFANTFIELTSSEKHFNVKTYVADFQLDNQLFEKGGYDFPVVLKSQNPLLISDTTAESLSTLKSNTVEIKNNSLLVIECSLDKVNNVTAFKNTYIRISPINIYVEDKFITQLLDYATTIVRPFSTIYSDNFNAVKIIIENQHQTDQFVNYINVPENILINARVISAPLRLQNLRIDPISILLSVHTSARLYVALDHSPLQFGIFERRNVFTTPYKLGNELTMHYLSGAIFGAGWVVGSLEILGSPGSFAQALSSGIKDFISLPFRGLLQGPWGFIIGITHGSASLMKHITAGTVNSVTKLASSVARNLDRLTLDDEHLQRQEEARRLRPQSMTQGLYRGLTGFGISVLAAVAGLAHHPLQNIWSQESSTRGIVTGVGLGLVGVVTKPLSGAAELVALTGQGLLQHTGWNSMPLIRRKPNFPLNPYGNTRYRYLWKLMDYLHKNHDSVIYLVDAEMIVDDTNSNKKLAVVLVLTSKNLIIIDVERDNVDKIISLSEFSCVDESTGNPKLLRLIFLMNNRNKPKNHSYTSDVEEMNNQMRSRVEQYVLTTGFNTYMNDESPNNEIIDKLMSSNYDENSLLFLFECFTKKCFISIIKVIKRQMLDIDFTVL